MVYRTWLSFKIDLASMNAFIQEAIPGSDGILADVEGFTVICPVRPENEGIVDLYLAGLTEEGELAKLTYPARVNEAVQSYKYTLLSKPYSALTLMDRKILMGLPLTNEEITNILNAVNTPEDL